MSPNAKDMVERSLVRSITGIPAKIAGINSNKDSIKLTSVFIQVCELCNRIINVVERGNFIIKEKSEIGIIQLTSKEAVESITNLGNNFSVLVDDDGFLIEEGTEIDLQKDILLEFVAPSITIYYKGEPIGNIKSVKEDGKIHRWYKNARRLRDFDKLIDWFEKEKVLHGTVLDHIWKRRSKHIIVSKPEEKIQSTLNEFFLDYILGAPLVTMEFKYPSGRCDFRLDDQQGLVLLVEIKVVGTVSGKKKNYTYKSNRVEGGILQLENYCSEESMINSGRLLVFDGENPRVSISFPYIVPDCLKLHFIYLVKVPASSKKK